MVGAEGGAVDLAGEAAGGGEAEVGVGEEERQKKRRSVSNMLKCSARAFYCSFPFSGSL